MRQLRMKMPFCDSKRSVVCAFVMVTLISAAMGFVIPDPSVEKASNSSVQTTTEAFVVHVEQPVERPAVVSEDLMLGPYNNPSIAANCRVQLASYGLEDNPKCGYVRTNAGSSTDIFLPGDPLGPVNRGVTLFELDPTTCKTRNRQRFDTYWSTNERQQLLNTLQSAEAGTIIIGVTADTAEYDNHDFQQTVGPVFIGYNMDLYGLGLRDKFAFIMQKGFPKKTIFQRKVRNTTSIEMNVLLSGSTVAEVTFSLC